MKFLWLRAAVGGKLKVTGRRLDAPAPPLRFSPDDSHRDFVPSYVIFSAPGCWEVTAQLEERPDSRLTFVVRVVKVGEGPRWHHG